ncbi:MAG: type II toxin-antitoxin system HicA family toxin [Candidatus Electryonea clarkiae]|nr:type II toxin-antitoxin system HicA family toxin [Candidatus Electryonea clarkiae]MDP8289144.1 type II toxin-antitoxin system HicA family toxin [Candidatus Electryonea clarkiae]
MSSKLPSVTSKKLIRALQRTGFFIHHQKGSHITLKDNSFPPKRVVVPFHTKDIKKGLLRGILKDAGISVEEFNNLL